jgi:hypothetical protein
MHVGTLICCEAFAYHRQACLRHYAHCATGWLAREVWLWVELCNVILSMLIIAITSPTEACFEELTQESMRCTKGGRVRLQSGTFPSAGLNFRMLTDSTY